MFQTKNADMAESNVVLPPWQRFVARLGIGEACALAFYGEDTLAIFQSLCRNVPKSDITLGAVSIFIGCIALASYGAHLRGIIEIHRKPSITQWPN